MQKCKHRKDLGLFGPSDFWICSSSRKQQGYNVRLGNNRQSLIPPARTSCRAISLRPEYRNPPTKSDEDLNRSSRTPLNMKDIVFLLALVTGTWALKYQAPPDNVRGRKFSLQAAHMPENTKIQERSDLAIRDIPISLELWDYWDQSIPRVD
jgi:hypothetical protein